RKREWASCLARPSGLRSIGTDGATGQAEGLGDRAANPDRCAEPQEDESHQASPRPPHAPPPPCSSRTLPPGRSGSPNHDRLPRGLLASRRCGLGLDHGDIATGPESTVVVRLASPLTPASFRVSRLTLQSALAP